jgi:hypothetical protein
MSATTEPAVVTDLADASARRAHPAGSAPGRVAGGCGLLDIARSLVVDALAWPRGEKPGVRQWHRLEAAGDIDGWAIGWPEGAEIGFHDHGGSEGVVLVVAGTLAETVLAPGPIGRPPLTVSRTLGPGDHLAFGPEHVHRMANPGDEPALSIHVYAPTLTSMTYFSAPDGDGLSPLSTQRF